MLFYPAVKLYGCNFKNNTFFAFKHIGAGNSADVQSCNFSDGLYGAIFEQTKHVRIFDCTFKDLNLDGIPSTLSEVDVSAGAVMLFNVGLCDARRSYFYDNSVGIHNPMFGVRPELGQGTPRTLPSNLFMDRCQFIRNGAGVYMVADLNGGVVSAVCSGFVDNNFGLAGRDIRLAIDAFANQTNPSQGLRPNYFELHGQMAATINKWFINICYTAATPSSLGSQQISGNAWV